MFWYRHAQFIGYSLDTRPLYSEGKYRALPKPETDIQVRCKVMETAAKEAKKKADTSSYCLKILVAPEFFFRSHKGAYELDDYQKVLSGLNAWASKSAWKHWIFVYGTIMATFQNDTGGREILNIALVQKGGSGPKNIHAIAKENLLEGDLLRRSQLKKDSPKGVLTFDDSVGVKSAKEFLGAKNRGDDAEFQKWGFDGRSIFDMYGVRIAVEICADHLGGRLSLSPTKKKSYFPQLQIVTACGVQGIIQENVVASKGGYIFLNDGFFLDGNGGRTRLSKITKPKPAKDQPAKLTDITNPTIIPMTGKLSGQWKKCFSQAGEIRIYPKQYIPWANKAK